MRRGRGSCRYGLTQGGGRISKLQRSNKFDRFSELRQPEKSRRGIWSRDLTCDHLQKSIVQGNTSRKRELSLLPYTGWRYYFIIVQRPNQFDQFSELGQHEKSRRGIWSRDLTCEHLQKSIVHGNASWKTEVSLLP